MGNRVNPIRDIMDFLEENPQPATVRRKIIRELFAIISNWTDFERTILESIDRGEILDTKKLKRMAWENMNHLSGADQIRSRLIFGPLEDEKLEFVDAGFIIAWAKE